MAGSDAENPADRRVRNGIAPKRANAKYGRRIESGARPDGGDGEGEGLLLWQAQVGDQTQAQV